MVGLEKRKGKNWPQETKESWSCKLNEPGPFDRLAPLILFDAVVITRFDNSTEAVYRYNIVKPIGGSFMETSIRKLGNSAGLILPAPLLKSLNLTIGQQFEIEKEGGRLVLTPKARKRYTAAELNAQCNPQAPMPEDLVTWENAPAAGSEAL